MIFPHAYIGDSYYGGYRTRTFQEVFPSANDFVGFLKECDIPLTIKEETARTLFGLLYANYGNSHVASSDENQFTYQVASTIYMYGPTWEKRVEIQKDLRELSMEELQRGTKDIHNTALNPGTSPTTATLEELTAINSQNTTNRKKSKPEAYATILALLETDVSKEFIAKFRPLFIKIAEPDYPLLYGFSAETLSQL